MQSQEITFSSDGFQHKIMNLMTIMEPAYPFFYVPKTILDDFKNEARTHATFQNVEYLENAIRFNSTCDQVQLLVNVNLTIQWTPEQIVYFTMRELLVPSEHVQGSDVGKCYIGIFPNTNAKEPNTFYLGQLYMLKYYTFFDVSGVQDNGTDHLTIGTGLKNHDATILQSMYNVSYPGFKVQAGDQSKWTYEPNKYTIIKKDDPITQFIKKNTVLFVLCCVILAFLIITLLCLCIYLKRKSNKNRMGNVFKDKMTYYGKQNTNTKVQQMDLSLSLDQGEGENSFSNKNVNMQRNNLA